MAPTESSPDDGLDPLWRNSPFIRLWGAQLISTLGSRMSSLAFPLLVLALTHSPFQAGLVGFVRGVPYVILSLPAGALIDRWNRKRVMVLCDLGRGVAFLTLAAALITGHILLLHLYAVALVEGTLYVFFHVAEVAALSWVVPEVQLPSAVGLNRAVYPLTGLAGTPLGGLLLQVGRAIPFAADAVPYLLSALALNSIRVSFQRARTTQRGALWAGMGEGLRWLWNERLFRSLALISVGNNFWDEGMGLIIIVLARAQGAAPVTIGIVFAIGAVGVLGHRSWWDGCETMSPMDELSSPPAGCCWPSGSCCSPCPTR